MLTMKMKNTIARFGDAGEEDVETLGYVCLWAVKV